MLLAGRYEIRSALGTGGMGRVYRGHDRVLDEDVAIKVLRFEVSRAQDMARRFLSEIKLARRVSHPNVCRIHEYGEHAGLRFISMEYIDGLTLKEFLRGGFLSGEAAFDVAIQAAQGLQAVHEMGVIHRDFKPSNLMIDSRGVARLVDFGIAKHAEHDATTSGPVLGTPEYMSPEQVRGDKLDFRSDIYALGCVAYEIFAGQAPFRGENPMDTVMKHMHEPLPLETPAARRIPPALLPVLRKALAKAPADRYARVADMTADLKTARQAEGLAEPSLRPLAVAAVGSASKQVPAVVTPESAPPPASASPAPSRRPVWAGLALLIAGTATWLTLSGTPGAVSGRVPASATGAAAGDPAAQSESCQPLGHPAPSSPRPFTSGVGATHDHVLRRARHYRRRRLRPRRGDRDLAPGPGSGGGGRAGRRVPGNSVHEGAVPRGRAPHRACAPPRLRAPPAQGQPAEGCRHPPQAGAGRKGHPPAEMRCFAHHLARCAAAV
jgi:serine/threonine-protein kinase